MSRDRLSANFALAEFERRAVVPDELVPRLRALCVEVLQPIRDRWGPITITSGYRPGAKTDGGKLSQHALAEAADFNMSAPRGEVWAWLLEAAAMGLPVDQCIEYERTNHIHVSHSTTKPNRRQFLVQAKAGKYVPWAIYKGPLKP